MKKRTLTQTFIFCFGVLLFLSGCSTHQTKLSEPRSLLKSGKFTEANEKLKELAEKPGDDQLVYLMEYGTGLQMAGQYKESNQVFLKADRLADRVDYHSVSNIALATLGSEEMIQYKGESYEKLLINASLALNYVNLGQFDDAMVEARRINEKIQKIRQEGRKDYEQNPFAHYLAALLWEADQKYDDAYIEYEATYKIDGRNSFLPGDLLRLGKKSRRDDAYNKWKKEFPKTKEDADWFNKGYGEIIVIVEQGWGPRKDFGSDRRVPKLYPVYSVTQAAKVELFNGNTKNHPSPLKPTETQTSKVVYDVSEAAIKTLDADYGWMIARKIGAFAAKEIVADQIRQKNEVLGLIAWAGMHLSDRADLRQWSTLPQTIQLARFWVPAGTYTLNLQGVDGSGGPSNDRQENVTVSVKAGRKAFHFWRTIH